MKRLLMFGLIQLIVLSTASILTAQSTELGTVTSKNPRQHCGTIRGNSWKRDLYFSFEDLPIGVSARDLEVGQVVSFKAITRAEAEARHPRYPRLERRPDGWQAADIHPYP